MSLFDEDLLLKTLVYETAKARVTSLSKKKALSSQWFDELRTLGLVLALLNEAEWDRLRTKLEPVKVLPREKEDDNLFE